jgi:hypothetical protein
MARRIALSLLGLLLAGCAAHTPPPPPSPSPRAAARPAREVAEVAPASRPALSILSRQRSPASAATAGDLGVPECDKYLQKIETCMLAKLPRAQQTQLREALASTRAAWKRLQAHDRQALELACLQAQDAARKMLTQFNCGW